LINVYETTGTTLIARAIVQEDSDGTIFSFTDGSASVRITGGVMTLGGTTVSSISPSIIAPILS
jgi:hypothetical protein